MPTMREAPSVKDRAAGISQGVLDGPPGVMPPSPLRAFLVNKILRKKLSEPLYGGVEKDYIYKR